MKNSYTNKGGNKKSSFLLAPILAAVLVLIIISSLYLLYEWGYLEMPWGEGYEDPSHLADAPSGALSDFDFAALPEYSKEPFCIVNDGAPYFTDSEITASSFEKYSSLDSLGRCGSAVASVGKDLMPTEDRESISHIKPTGWKSVQYDHVDGKSLYNRCHLIGFQLTGENANEKNLITGTRYMNVDGMLPFENMIADYVKETGNHVMYRVTPVFVGNELVARGVLMEGYSVEDEGEGICFNVFAYNVQPYVIINYLDGTSKEAPLESSKDGALYILNTSSKKFHLPTCSSAKEMNEKNKKEFKGDKSELIAKGYEGCGYCKP